MSRAMSREVPRDEATLAQLVGEAFITRTSIEILGGGSKRAIGPPVEAQSTIDVRSISGVTLHETAELVIGARAGTPLSQLVSRLDAAGQMLPFEPADYRALLGSGDGEPTVGGLVAANMSGPRRISAGACRDSLIGVRFVNGRGEAIKSGGRVMKNVTGYDLSKLMAGAWGTLGILTEAIFKVLPKPEVSGGLVWSGLNDQDAIALMSAALGSPYEVSAAAHLPAGPSEPARTIIRVENFARSVTYRSGELARSLKRFGSAEMLDERSSTDAFRTIGDVGPFVGKAGAVWRVSLAPSKAAATVAAIRAGGDAEAFYDWGGGLVWLSLDALEAGADCGAALVRGAVAEAGGHVMLIRAPDPARASVPVFEPAAPALDALARRVKAGFDPKGVLNPGRMHEGV